MVKINLGCGLQIVEGWINVDYSFGAKLAKFPLFAAANRALKIFSTDWDKRIFLHDLRKPFPWADATVDIIYSSHTLEHLSREEGRFFLKESHRVLKPGGTIRILVPDLACTVKHYLEGKTSADRFVEGLGVLYGSGKNSWRKYLAPLIEVPHKCHYDTPTLISILADLGFRAEGRKGFESAIPDIARIELQDRTENAVVVEGIKAVVNTARSEKSSGAAAEADFAY